MLPTKIVAIGAASEVFGFNTLVTLLRNPVLKGSHLALVDRDERALANVFALAQRLNTAWQAGMTITSSTHPGSTLDGAEFVILAIAASPREGLWKTDWEIPLKYGVRQPYAENGGPGGFIHAARNIGPVLEIARQIEAACPDAWLINFTNPMQRICDAVARYSRIKVVGLCHQIAAGYAMVGKVLAADLGIQDHPGFTSTHSSPEINPHRAFVARQAMKKVDIKAAGLNHFTWMLDLREKSTGRDLYPLFADRWQAFDPAFEPLTRQVYQSFGIFPIPGDEHLCEYLPWVSDPTSRPWERYDLSLYDWDLYSTLRDVGRERVAQLAQGQESLQGMDQVDSEGAAEVIAGIAGVQNDFWPAVNLPNQGYITNLPAGAIVETPGVFTGYGVMGIGVGALPEPVAELCRREITASRLCVDAAVHGDRQTALQCLLLDPIIRDMQTASHILEDYLAVYCDYLPQFQ